MCEIKKMLNYYALDTSKLHTSSCNSFKQSPLHIIMTKILKLTKENFLWNENFPFFVGLAYSLPMDKQNLKHFVCPSV